MDYRLHWFIVFITIGKFCSIAQSLDLFFSVRNYLRKLPFCWLNSHLQTVKIIILTKQWTVQCEPSSPLTSPYKSHTIFFCTKLISQVACDWLCNIFLSINDLQNCTTTGIVSSLDCPFLIDSFATKYSYW